jgi:hypothetical protein
VVQLWLCSFLLLPLPQKDPQLLCCQGVLSGLVLHDRQLLLQSCDDLGCLCCLPLQQLDLVVGDAVRGEILQLLLGDAQACDLLVCCDSRMAQVQVQ